MPHSQSSGATIKTAELTALPLADRLRAMEALWDSLTRGAQSDAPVPGWHAEVLRARANALAAGAESTSSWTDAKNRIRENAEKLTVAR